MSAAWPSSAIWNASRGLYPSASINLRSRDIRNQVYALDWWGESDTLNFFPDCLLGGSVGEGDIRALQEAQDGGFMLHQVLLQSVRVGSCNSPAPTVRESRDIGHLLAALGQDGSIVQASAISLGQNLGRACIDPMAGRAQQGRHSMRAGGRQWSR